MANRQPKGIPVGGEFAANEHDESEVALNVSPASRLSSKEQQERVDLLRSAAENSDRPENAPIWWDSHNLGATEMAEQVLEDVKRIEKDDLDPDDAVVWWLESARRDQSIVDANTFTGKFATLNSASGRKTEAVYAAVMSMRGDSAAFSDANSAVIEGRETDEVIDLISNWRK